MHVPGHDTGHEGGRECGQVTQRHVGAFSPLVGRVHGVGVDAGGVEALADGEGEDEHEGAEVVGAECHDPWGEAGDEGAGEDGVEESKPAKKGVGTSGFRTLEPRRVELEREQEHPQKRHIARRKKRHTFGTPRVLRK